MMANPQLLHGRTGRANFARLAVLVLAATFILPAQAQDVQLQNQVRASESDLAEALAAHPSYQAVADGIAADCADKLPEDARISDFCHCATAVTFSLWRSKIDEGAMLEKLNTYLQNPGASGVAELLRAQGPGFYKSACEKVLGKS
jgi:hypothetical protein